MSSVTDSKDVSKRDTLKDLDKARESLVKSSVRTLKLYLDRFESAYEEEIFDDLYNGVVHSLGVASRADQNEVKESKARFLSDYSMKSASGMVASKDNILEIFKGAMSRNMATTFEEILDSKNNLSIRGKRHESSGLSM